MASLGAVPNVVCAYILLTYLFIHSTDIYWVSTVCQGLCPHEAYVWQYLLVNAVPCAASTGRKWWRGTRGTLKNSREGSSLPLETSFGGICDPFSGKPNRHQAPLVLCEALLTLPFCTARTSTSGWKFNSWIECWKSLLMAFLATGSNPLCSSCAVLTSKLSLNTMFLRTYSSSNPNHSVWLSKSVLYLAPVNTSNFLPSLQLPFLTGSFPCVQNVPLACSECPLFPPLSTWFPGPVPPFCLLIPQAPS